MSIVNKLRYSATDLTLQGGTAGLQTSKRGWLPNVAPALAWDSPGLITETFAVMAEGTSHDNLAAYLQTLAQYQRYAAMYKADTSWNIPVWLHSKLSGETGELRALVDSIAWAWDSSPFDSVPSTQYAMSANIEITRMPYWERTVAREFPIDNPIAAAAAVVYDYTAADGFGVAAHDIVGDAPARVEAFFIASATAGFTMARTWCGIRAAEKHGTLANFVATWEAEDGTNAAGAADTVDATASDGNMVRFTPAGSDTWLKVCTVQLGDVTANYSDNLGRFMWLLRYKVNGASTYQVRLRFGYSGMDDADHVYGPIPDAITNASYDFIEMGQCSIPLRNWQAATADMTATLEQDFQVEIWAKRTVGAGTLDVDCLVRIPVDQGYLMVRDAAIGNGEYLVFSETPNGATQCIHFDGTKLTEFLDYDAWNFRLPVGDGRMIFAYARSASQVITDTIGAGRAIGWDGYLERWTSMRGVE
jgi:hypothetical protein